MKSIPTRTISSTNEKQGLSIRRVEDFLGGQDLEEPIHKHDFYFLLCIQHGKGSHEIDFQQYEVFDGAVFFLRPGQAHRLNLKAGSTGWLLQFNRSVLIGFSASVRQKTSVMGISNASYLSALHFQKVIEPVENLSIEVKGHNTVDLALAVAYMTVALVQLDRYGQSAERVIGKNYQLEQLDTLINLVDEHFKHWKKGKEYASQMNLSLYQLNAITRNCLNKTCADIINDRVILEAKRLLLTTSMQVNQIAYELGFTDASYFSRFFKKHVGGSPEQLKENYR